jgi:hypothetical protein
MMTGDAAKYISKRYALERYLGWTQDEILENEKLYKEENARRITTKTGANPMDTDQVGLSSLGIRPEPTADLGMGMGGEMGAPQPPMGGEPSEPPLGSTPGTEPTPGPAAGPQV